MMVKDDGDDKKGSKKLVAWGLKDEKSDRDEFVY